MVPVVVYRAKTARRGSRRLKPIEKLVRRLVAATGVSAEVYSVRHRTSNEKKKNGWLRDFPKNMMKAQRRALKQIRRG